MAKHCFSSFWPEMTVWPFNRWSIHPFAVHRALQKRFFSETRDWRKTASADCLLAWVAQTEPAVAALPPAPIAKTGFSGRDRLHARAWEIRSAESEGSPGRRSAGVRRNFVNI